MCGHVILSADTVTIIVTVPADKITSKLIVTDIAGQHCQHCRVSAVAVGHVCCGFQVENCVCTLIHVTACTIDVTSVYSRVSITVEDTRYIGESARTSSFSEVVFIQHASPK